MPTKKKSTPRRQPIPRLTPAQKAIVLGDGGVVEHIDLAAEELFNLAAYHFAEAQDWAGKADHAESASAMLDALENAWRHRTWGIGLHTLAQDLSPLGPAKGGLS
ncbi:MAG: hypothetical protein PHE83_05725 [Opitutaceae bacterium]|nr:hypothetical protein [Opitutaceae bacterium]